MRRQTHSPDELREIIAHEVEEIRNELDRLRSRVEAQQASSVAVDPQRLVYDSRPVIDITTR